MCIQRLQSNCLYRAFEGWLSRVEAKKAAKEKMQVVRIALVEGVKVRTAAIQYLHAVVLLSQKHSMQARPL